VSEKKSARSADSGRQKVKKGKMSVKKDDCQPIKKIKSRGRREISFNAPPPVFFDIVCARCVDAVYRILFFFSLVCSWCCCARDTKKYCVLSVLFFFCVGLIGRSRVTFYFMSQKKKKITKSSKRSPTKGGDFIGQS
jgi:hypothetical protein